MDVGFRPQIIPDPAAVSPGEETLGEVLPLARFSDLYRLVKEEGLPYFARLNSQGNVELFLVFENIDAFSEATNDQVSLEFKTYQTKLLAIIWTLDDPIQPLGFPLSFEVEKAEDRFIALRMLEQEEVPLHYLVFEQELITHLFSETITISAEEKKRVEVTLRLLFEGNDGGGGAANTAVQTAEVKEEPITSIPAVSLSKELLCQSGTCYLFHLRAMAEKHGETEAQNLLMSALQQAVLVMRRHSRSEVRESSFLVWAGQQDEWCSLIVTPVLDYLFKVVHQTEEEANPFSRFLLALPEFIGTDDVRPLQRGAFPILRYHEGKVYHLELAEETQQYLAKLFVQLFPDSPNPYA